MPTRRNDVPSNSAVANVLREVLDSRSPEKLVGIELDGRYKIERQVGEGGMGVVYLARHVVIEKAVAIKVLRAEVAADESVVKRFVLEARAASRIGHPNIIDVTDFGTTREGLTYQVMEFLEGKTLNQVLKENTYLELPRALAIIAQMARALGAAHDKGIVHRDLKPENVFLLERDGRSDFVKIVDFGIAKVQPTDGNASEQRLTRVGTVFGTPEYMAPEQAAGRTDVDLRADIYALGTILYEMLAGRVPHRGATTVNTLAMQMLDEPAPMRSYRPDLEISADLERVIMQSLAKKREARFASMPDFLHALEEVTSKTELDLPLLMQQERMSSQLVSQQNHDTIPETDVPASMRSKAPTSAQELANRAAALPAGRQRRVSRVTDPVFLRSDRSTSLSNIAQDAYQDSAQMPAQSRSHAYLVGLALLLVGGSVGAFVLLHKQDDPSAALVKAELDAGAKTVLTPPPAMDASAPEPSDAGAAEPTIDAGKGTHATGKGQPKLVPPPPNDKIKRPLLAGELEVTVVTRPRGAQLFIDRAYAGSDGLNLRRSSGTSLSVGCHMSGYLDGEVQVDFDGKREVFLCRLREVRKRNCVEGVKNPFDDCP